MKKLYAHRDGTGKVHGLISYEAADDSGMTLETPTGHSLAEMLAPQLEDGPGAVRQLRDLARRARIEGEANSYWLVQSDE